MKSAGDDLKEEERRIQELRRLVDQAAIELQQSALSYEDSRRIIEQTREKAVELFPDKGDLFDLIYRSRFYRILDENFFNSLGR